MNRFENTKLWQESLGVQIESELESKPRAKLRQALEEFRERAGMLAGEISRDLPDFTVHDISHIDALWEMADLIAGKEYTLTPAESFVLGGSFLIHDLGMGLASYPEGVSQLRKGDLWNDTVISLLKKKLNRIPRKEEIDNIDKGILEDATKILLRQLHAKHAEKLALISWESTESGSEEYYLISDPDLRNTYGKIIGQIAHSHWLAIDELNDYLPKIALGAPGNFPNEWTVDPIKLACILRVADASHLDERRAPKFLQAIRKPEKYANKHWIFQAKLYQPRVENDRLLYTSKGSFGLEQVDDWWLCYDALKMVDRELRQVDAFLGDNKKPRLAVNGVSYIENPKRLSLIIHTEYWKPIDTQIKVSAVADLVSKLGGEQLYGKDIFVPIRELIQNASDAIRARRLLENEDSTWGDICIRYGQNESSYWIEVEDNGVGMTPEVLTGTFLDFGTSFWGSGLMHSEFPGLEYKGFQSTGRYGIGFFSAFMIGERVQVITRRYEESRDNTHVLEFRNGLHERAILRKAERFEYIKNGGTKIRIWLKDREIFRNIVHGVSDLNEEGWKIEERIGWICPAIDANIYVSNNESKGKNVICANDWIDMDGEKLIQRIIQPCTIKGTELEEHIKLLSNNLRIIKNSCGKIVGRACIAPMEIDNTYYGELRGNVTIGGFRSCDLAGILGILKGETKVASRNSGFPSVEKEKIKEWSSDQADLVNKIYNDMDILNNCSQFIIKCGGDTGNNPIATNKNGFISFDDIINNYAIHNEIIIIEDYILYKYKNLDLTFKENVIILDSSISVILQAQYYSEWPNEARSWKYEGVLLGKVIEALSVAWECEISDILEVSICDYRDTIDVEVGMCKEEAVTSRSYIIRRPESIIKQTREVAFDEV